MLQKSQVKEIPRISLLSWRKDVKTERNRRILHGVSEAQARSAGGVMLPPIVKMNSRDLLHFASTAHMQEVPPLPHQKYFLPKYPLLIITGDRMQAQVNFRSDQIELLRGFDLSPTPIFSLKTEELACLQLLAQSRDQSWSSAPLPWAATEPYNS